MSRVSPHIGAHDEVCRPARGPSTRATAQAPCFAAAAPRPEELGPELPWEPPWELSLARGPPAAGARRGRQGPRKSPTGRALGSQGPAPTARRTTSRPRIEERIEDWVCAYICVLMYVCVCSGTRVNA